MKKILAATDLSERADRALTRAVRLAEEQGGEVTVLFVASDDLPANVREQFVRASEIGLADQLERVCPGTRAKVVPTVQSGRDWAVILEVAELGGFDLVVLGTHRMDRVGYLLGSTVERLIAHVSVPVLVVPKPAERAYERPIVAVDFSIHSRRAVKLARALAPEARIAAVHAWEVPLRAFLRSAESRKKIEAEEAGRLERLIEREFADLIAAVPDGHEKLEPVLRRGEAVKVLEAEVAARKADLLVLGTHGGGGLREAMVGSTAKAFLKLPPCDVAVVKAW
jgi:nucleotide-binding universal stress UspA family protein